MKSLILTSVLVSVLFLSSCRERYFFRQNYKQASAVMHDSLALTQDLFLKAHMKNGDLYVLHNKWEIDTVDETIIGRGEKYNANRKLVSSEDFIIPLDGVAIYETNKKLGETEKKRIAALAVLASIDATFGLFCLSNPKACFGSCPTFYVDPNESFHDANAEGFSNAVVPSLEYTDIDDLKHVQESGSQFSLWMKNEALETHCVNNISLLAAPKLPNETVLQDVNDIFFIWNGGIYARKTGRNCFFRIFWFTIIFF